MELRKAALVLSDISGYTKFLKLHTMSLLHAEKIITELMEAVIDVSRHPLTLYKLEGDALLFYAFAESATDAEEHRELNSDVLNQALAFFHAFRAKADNLIGCNACPCDGCRQVSDLRLKSILHFGEVAVKKVRQFEELAGEEVILAHRLLKNSIPSDEYLLVTETFYEKSDGGDRRGEIEFENRTEECDGIGPVPVMVYYPNPAPAPSPRGVLPTLVNGVRLDGYGMLRAMGLKGAPSPIVASMAGEACVSEGQSAKRIGLGNFLADAWNGIGMLLRGQGK